MGASHVAARARRSFTVDMSMTAANVSWYFKAERAYFCGRQVQPEPFEIAVCVSLRLEDAFGVECVAGGWSFDQAPFRCLSL